MINCRHTADRLFHFTSLQQALYRWTTGAAKRRDDRVEGNPCTRSSVSC
jgi:hypothetical protein